MVAARQLLVPLPGWRVLAIRLLLLRQQPNLTMAVAMVAAAAMVAVAATRYNQRQQHSRQSAAVAAAVTLATGPAVLVERPLPRTQPPQQTKTPTRAISIMKLNAAQRLDAA